MKIQHMTTLPLRTHFLRIHLHLMYPIISYFSIKDIFYTPYTPRLSNSHSAPLYLSGVDDKAEQQTAGGPMIIEPPPKEAVEILFSHNGSLQRSVSGQCMLNVKGTFGLDKIGSIEKTGTSFFKQGTTYFN